MGTMNLRPVRIEEETRLRCEFQLETTGRNSFQYTLIARFSGDYRDGSAGKPDARFIAGMTRMGVAIWHPAALILDLSELRYEWGDDLGEILPPGGKHLRSAVVIGPGCARAIATLLWGVNTQKAATEAEFIFDNLEAAWEAVRYQA
jgi:hypothetical protein